MGRRGGSVEAGGAGAGGAGERDGAEGFDAFRGFAESGVIFLRIGTASTKRGGMSGGVRDAWLSMNVAGERSMAGYESIEVVDSG